MFLGLLSLVDPSLAGTGRLVSNWMSRAPAIDGELDAEEWAEAAEIDLGSGVTARIGNDGRTLYLMMVDGRPGEPAGDRMALLFDDDGGTAPLLDDGAWTSAVCQSDPALGEGEIWFAVSGGVDFYEWESSSPGECSAQALGGRQRSAVGLNFQLGVIYEVALPLDGPLPLHAAPGQRLAFELRAVDGSGLGQVCYPNCSLAPADFRNLVLASGGCNTGPRDFGSGEPRIGPPLDWTSEIMFGNGQGWLQSGVDHEPTLCIGNATGGSGAALCAANALQGSPHTESLLRMPLSLAGWTSARVRMRAILQVDPYGNGMGDSLTISSRGEDGLFSRLLEWQAQDYQASLNLALFMASNPAELWFTHSTLAAGGEEGGFAQIDDFELLCSPGLFSDDFESGLTTHWSATAP